MDDQYYNFLKQESLERMHELRMRWNDKFLSDIKDVQNNRVLVMQNIAGIVAGLIGAGIFFDKIYGYYANISVFLAFVTLSIIVLHLRELLDKQSNESNQLFKEQNELFNEHGNKLQEISNYEEYDELIIKTKNKLKLNESENNLLDYSNEFINFLFILTLMFLGASLSQITFSFYYIAGIVLISFIITFSPTYHTFIHQINYILTKIKK